jgi:Lamin Tail Domain
MASPLTRKQWIIVILVNIVVSTVTALMIVRVLTNQPVPKGASAQAPTELSAASPTQAVPAVQATPPTTEQPSATSATDTPAQAETTVPTVATSAPAGQSATTAATATAAASGAANVRISAVLYPGQRQREVVVIVNEGAEVSMKSWTLSSRNITYTFGNVTLFSDSFINLHTTSGADVPIDLFWNRSEPAWQSGDELSLADGSGKVIATYKVK